MLPSYRIALYGTHNYDHGTFSVQLDSQAAFSASGVSSDQVIGQQLYRADNLSANQTHQITITNSQAAWLDLDYIVYETAIGADGSVCERERARAEQDEGSWADSSCLASCASFPVHVETSRPRR